MSRCGGTGLADWNQASKILMSYVQELIIGQTTDEFKVGATPSEAVLNLDIELGQCQRL